MGSCANGEERMKLRNLRDNENNDDDMDDKDLRQNVRACPMTLAVNTLIEFTIIS